jgi:hypothetical protein
MTEPLSQRRRPWPPWERFWFAPRPVSTLALFRILYGLLVSLWALALLPDALALLSADGVLPAHPRGRPLRTGLLAVFTSDLAVLVVVGGLAVVGLLLALGAWTRTVSIINFVLLLSIARRNPHMANAGDSLIRHFGFFLMFAPAGAALSWDRWRRARDHFWSVPERSPWAQRLLQLQVSIVYLFSTIAKLQGDEWLDGSALSQVWRAGDFLRLGMPLVLVDSVMASKVATYATLVIEDCMAALIWNRRARPYVITGGLLLHLGIELTMAVGFFSAVVCCGYLLFLPEERGVQLIGWVRERVTRRPRQGAQGPRDDGTTTTETAPATATAHAPAPWSRLCPDPPDGRRVSHG